MTSYITTTSQNTGWSISHQVPTVNMSSTSTATSTSTSANMPMASDGGGAECDAGWERTGAASCEEPGWNRNVPGMCLEPEWQINVNTPPCRPDTCMIVARDEANIKINKFFSHSDRLKECGITRVKTGLSLPACKRNRPCTNLPFFRTQLERLKYMRNNLRTIAEERKIYCDPYIYRNCGCVCEPEPKCPPCGGVYREPLQLGGSCGCGSK